MPNCLAPRRMNNANFRPPKAVARALAASAAPRGAPPLAAPSTCKSQWYTTPQVHHRHAPCASRLRSLRPLTSRPSSPPALCVHMCRKPHTIRAHAMTSYCRASPCSWRHRQDPALGTRALRQGGCPPPAHCAWRMPFGAAQHTTLYHATLPAPPCELPSNECYHVNRCLPQWRTLSQLSIAHSVNPHLHMNAAYYPTLWARPVTLCHSPFTPTPISLTHYQSSR